MDYSLGESELIITPKGTIYHLDIAPEQLADTIITVGDPDRVQEISKHFDRIECKAQNREFITHTGYVGKKHLSVISTGIGTDNIDIVLNELDALANINFQTRRVNENLKQLSIIRLGTSGSLQAEIPVDSFVVSDFAIGLDNLLHYYRFENNPEELEILKKFEDHTHLERNKLSPYIASSSRKLSNYFQQGYHHGTTVTCPGFYGPQGRGLRVQITNTLLIDSLTTFNHHLPITNFEMETSAIYGLGKILNHHCLSISTIVNNRIHKIISKDSGKSIEKMILQSLEIIEGIN